MPIIKATKLYVSLTTVDPVPVGFAIKAERETPSGNRWLVKESQVRVLGLIAGIHYNPTEDGLVAIRKEFFDE